MKTRPMPASEFDLKPVDFEWYALYTKGRHEKLIDRDLKRKNIESFLPLRKIKKRWSDRVMTVEEPLFKSYIFVKTDLAHTLNVLRIKGAVKFVSIQGSPVPVGEKIILSLKHLVSQDIRIDPFPYLGLGDRVSVCSGIFKGIEGYILRKDDQKCRLVISIDAMMASVSVEVDSCLVEKV